jgi:hypothetical protein
LSGDVFLRSVILSLSKDQFSHLRVKTYLIFALAWIAALKLPADNSQLPTDDSLAPKLSLTIEAISQDGHIKIGIHNQSADKIRIWTGPCSWAYFNWRVIDVRGDEIRLYCPNPDEFFTRNGPQYATLQLGAMISENLKLGGDDEWVNGERPLMHWAGPNDTLPLLKNGDKIIILYDVRGSQEANKYSVWTGLAAVNKEYHLK